ncbi:MAG: hypothetical protein WDO19_19405, partial [Bacteroidota bacterium]
LSLVYFAYSKDTMSLSLEERKLQYIQTIEAEYMPAEKSWWQHPAPLYHLTKEYTDKHKMELIAGEPVLFKKARKERAIVGVMFVVAALLIYLLGKNDFGFTHVLFLLLLLIVVLPILLNNKTMIRISREGIWWYKEDKDIRWQNILLTYIKEVHDEHTHYSFIIHYYDEIVDGFRRTEMELGGWVSPWLLSATVEAYKNA